MFIILNHNVLNDVTFILISLVYLRCTVQFFISFFKFLRQNKFSRHVYHQCRRYITTKLLHFMYNNIRWSDAVTYRNTYVSILKILKILLYKQ